MKHTKYILAVGYLAVAGTYFLIRLANERKTFKLNRNHRDKLLKVRSEAYEEGWKSGYTNGRIDEFDVQQKRRSEEN